MSVKGVVKRDLGGQLARPRDLWLHREYVGSSEATKCGIVVSPPSTPPKRLDSQFQNISIMPANRGSGRWAPPL